MQASEEQANEAQVNEETIPQEITQEAAPHESIFADEVVSPARDTDAESSEQHTGSPSPAPGSSGNGSSFKTFGNATVRSLQRRSFNIEAVSNGK